MSTLLVLTNLPDRAAAEKLADAIVANNLAAGGNSLAPCRPVDRWKGAAQPELPPGLPQKDEFFGEMPIYRGQVSIRLPAQSDGPVDLKVTSQGCADAGVCYVPMESRATLRLTGSGAALDSEPRFSLYASDLDIAHLLQGNFALVLGGFLVLGLLLAFTPCMLPMIPILSGIIAGDGGRMNKSRALTLSVTYVLSMALTYALAGVAAAYAGSLLASYLQNVWVLGAFALVV